MTNSRTWIAASTLAVALAAAYLALVPMLSSVGSGTQWPDATQDSSQPALQVVVAQDGYRLEHPGQQLGGRLRPGLLVLVVGLERRWPVVGAREHAAGTAID